jgi:hypothetical protein
LIYEKFSIRLIVIAGITAVVIATTGALIKGGVDVHAMLIH